MEWMTIHAAIKCFNKAELNDSAWIYVVQNFRLVAFGTEQFESDATNPRSNQVSRNSAPHRNVIYLPVFS
jgi:hypothetical protein